MAPMMKVGIIPTAVAVSTFTRCFNNIVGNKVKENRTEAKRQHGYTVICAGVLWDQTGLCIVRH